jgi:hypothetical protein
MAVSAKVLLVCVGAAAGALPLSGLADGRSAPGASLHWPVARPDWIREHSPLGALDEAISASGAPVLVLQQDRPDGTDLLTVRVPLLVHGRVSAFAGAGVNRASYYGDVPDPGAAVLERRNRRSGLGGAAELGAQWRLARDVLLNADLRWAGLDADASLLQSGETLVAADPVTVGLSLGWRFH